MQPAVFSDVEGTLIDGSVPRIFLEIGKQQGLFSSAQRAQIGLLSAMARLLPPKLGRRAQILMVLVATRGQRPADVQRWSERGVPVLMQRFKPHTRERLEAHRQAGLPLVLVSAGMHEAISLLGRELGARGEGTKLHTRNGRYTMRVMGGVCQGEAKAERALAVIREMDYDPAQSFAYGDTGSDIPFLALFGHPHAVDPDLILAAEAERRGWPIITRYTPPTPA